MAKGIDVRQTTGSIDFRAFLQDSVGDLVTTGTGNLRLYELQSSGTLKSFDWATKSFTYDTLSVEHTGMTHQSGNNNNRATAIWTSILPVITGFSSGNIYFAQVEHSGASPILQTREFQFGDEQGDGLNAVADATLRRDLSAVVGVNYRSLLNALRFLRNKWTISGSTLTVYKEDDTTIAWTAILSSSPSDPVTGSDPS